MTRIKRPPTILLALLLLLPVTAGAQKAFRDIRTQLKAKKSADALSAVQKLEKDSTLRLDPRLYDFGVQAYVQQNEAENEKIYLQQKADTAKLFQTALGIYRYILRCDTAETYVLETKHKQRKFRKPHALLVHTYYNNLCAGGRWYYAKRDYKQALQYLLPVLDVPYHPVWTATKNAPVPERYTESAVLAVRSAFLTGDTATVVRFAAEALKDTSAARRLILENVAQTAKLRGDTIAWLAYLEEGLEQYPEVPYFFTDFTDYYTRREDYAASLRLAERMLRTDSVNFLFLTAKSLALINLGRDREAIEAAKLCLLADSTNADTYYYIGASYCNLASSVGIPSNFNSPHYKKATTERRNYYLLARPYLERYRELQPDERRRWAPLLYSIYLALNQGPQFEEIQHIMKEIYAK